MRLEKVWALIGLYWVLFTISYSFLPYEMALILVTAGYYSCFPLLAGTLVLSVYRRFRNKPKKKESRIGTQSQFVKTEKPSEMPLGGLRRQISKWWRSTKWRSSR